MNNAAKVINNLGINYKNPNADNLLGFKIDDCFVWLNKDYANNEKKYIFFPAGVVINPIILSRLNYFSNSALNADNTKKGFFDANGRVRAIKLRGLPSEGFVISLEDFFIGINKPFVDLNSDEEFNMYEDIWVCKKYEAPQSKSSFIGIGSVKSKNIIDSEFFKPYGETEHFIKNLKQFDLSTLIDISYKLHGTSGISGYIKVKKQHKFFGKFYQKIKNFFGLQTEKDVYEYADVCSSKSVIRKIGNRLPKNHEKDNIWLAAHRYFEEIFKNHPALKDLIFYYEIVGYFPGTNMCIQKNYDYGCNPGEFKIYIYKILDTGIKESHNIYYFWECLEYVFKNTPITIVPLIHSGTLQDFINKDETATIEQAVENLKNNPKVYQNKNCYMCKNKVPAEGIVILKLSTEKPYKMKWFNFINQETNDDTLNIEDNETNI